MAGIDRARTFLEEYVPALICPIELAPLKYAVKLSPCDHKINELMAYTIFGGVHNPNQKDCPVCKKIVVRYQVDLDTREQAVSEIFRESYKELNGEYPPEAGKPTHPLPVGSYRAPIEQSFEDGILHALVHQGRVPIPVRRRPSVLQRLGAGLLKVVKGVGSVIRGMFRILSKCGRFLFSPFLRRGY